MNNSCHFSKCRTYRYTLIHEWDELFARRRCIFICLNPSTANESSLDNTLTRIRDFSTRLEANEFTMLNLFAFRATDPKVMLAAQDPVGPENDRAIVQAIDEALSINHDRVDIVCGWGRPGKTRGRDREVIQLLSNHPHFDKIRLLALFINNDGTPKHPLYIRADQPFLDFQ